MGLRSGRGQSLGGQVLGASKPPAPLALPAPDCCFLSPLLSPLLFSFLHSVIASALGQGWHCPLFSPFPGTSPDTPQSSPCPPDCPSLVPQAAVLPHELWDQQHQEVLRGGPAWEVPAVCPRWGWRQPGPRTGLGWSGLGCLALLWPAFPTASFSPHPLSHPGT